MSDTCTFSCLVLYKYLDTWYREYLSWICTLLTLIWIIKNAVCNLVFNYRWRYVLNSPECNLLDQTGGNSDRGLLAFMYNPSTYFQDFLSSPYPEGPDIVQDINLLLLIAIIPNKSKWIGLLWVVFPMITDDRLLFSPLPTLDPLYMSNHVTFCFKLDRYKQHNNCL